MHSRQRVWSGSVWSGKRVIVVLEGVLLPPEVHEDEVKIEEVVFSESLLNLYEILRSHFPNWCIR
jgi:hypothetical protein